MNQKTTVLQSLLFVFLWCCVVVNAAGLNDVDAIEKMTDKAIEVGKNAVEANKDFSVNADKAMKTLKESVYYLELSNYQFCHKEARFSDGCLNLLIGLKKKTEDAYEESFILNLLKTSVLEEWFTNMSGEEINKIKKSISLVKKNMINMSNGASGNQEKTVGGGDVHRALESLGKLKELIENVKTTSVSVKLSVARQTKNAKSAESATNEAITKVEAVVKFAEENIEGENTENKLLQLAQKVRDKLSLSLEAIDTIVTKSTEVQKYVNDAIKEYENIAAKIEKLKEELTTTREMPKEHETTEQQKQEGEEDGALPPAKNEQQEEEKYVIEENEKNEEEDGSKTTKGADEEEQEKRGEEQQNNKKNNEPHKNDDDDGGSSGNEDKTEQMATTPNIRSTKNISQLVENLITRDGSAAVCLFSFAAVVHLFFCCVFAPMFLATMVK